MPTHMRRNYCQTQAEVQAELNQLISYHDETKKQYTLSNAAENAALVSSNQQLWRDLLTLFHCAGCPKAGC